MHGAIRVGKSTLLNVLGLLDRADDGTYLLAGQDVSELDDSGRARMRNLLLGFVFQLHNLLPRTTALENVTTPLVYRGVRRAERLRRRCARSRWSAWPTARTTTPMSSPVARCSAWRSPARSSATPKYCSSTSRPATSTWWRPAEVLELLDALHDQGRTIVMITHEEDVAEHADRRLVLGDGVLHDYHSKAAEAHR